MISSFFKTLIFFSFVTFQSVNAASSVSQLNSYQFKQLQALFKQLIVSKNIPSKTQWALAGISMTESEDTITLKADNKTLFYIGEVVIKKKRDVSSPLLMLQAPHQFYDLNTGKIVDALFKDNKYQIKMLNSAQRYSSKNSDVAHQELTIFSAFAEVFAKQNNQAKIIQLHGFSSSKRKSNAGRYADIIISNGTEYSDSYLRELQICHRDEIGVVTRIYGYDVFELGATKNKIGRRLNKRQEGQFIHIELSKEIRENFNDATWINGFNQCI